MEVTLNIPNAKDWISIEPLLSRLGITIVSSKQEEHNDDLADWDIILKGVKKSNMDSFLNDFEQSRLDREQPFRVS